MAKISGCRLIRARRAAQIWTGLSRQPSKLAALPSPFSCACAKQPVFGLGEGADGDDGERATSDRGPAGGHGPAVSPSSNCRSASNARPQPVLRAASRTQIAPSFALPRPGRAPS